MKLKQTYKNNKLTTFARINRKAPTKAENKFWQSFRSRRFLGYKFRRQVPIGSFIVDFYCEELKLVIEIDGSSHNENKFYYDLERQKDLESLGVKILRFTEFEIMNNFDSVFQSIENYIPNLTSSQPSPQGEGARVEQI